MIAATRRSARRRIRDQVVDTARLADGDETPDAFRQATRAGPLAISPTRWFAVRLLGSKRSDLERPRPTTPAFARWRTTRVRRSVCRSSSPSRTGRRISGSSGSAGPHLPTSRVIDRARPSRRCASGGVAAVGLLARGSPNSILGRRASTRVPRRIRQPDRRSRASSMDLDGGSKGGDERARPASADGPPSAVNQARAVWEPIDQPAARMRSLSG